MDASLGEDADDIGATLHFLVQSFQRVGGMDYGPVLGREAHVGKHVELAVVHEGGELRPARAHLVGDEPECLARRFLVGLEEYLAQRGGDHAGLGLGHVGERVAHPMDAAALPCGRQRYRAGYDGLPDCKSAPTRGPGQCLCRPLIWQWESTNGGGPDRRRSRPHHEQPFICDINGLERFR